MANEYQAYQLNAETWRTLDKPNEARANQVNVEVWRTLTGTTASNRRRQVMVNSF